MITFNDEQQKQLERMLDLLESRKEPYCRWPGCHKNIDEEQVHSELCINTKRDIADLRAWMKENS